MPPEVRVVPRAEAQLAGRRTPYFQEYRVRGIPASRIPDEVVDPVIEQVMTAPQDRLLSVGAEFRLEVPQQPDTFASDVCEVCGELVVERYLRIDGELMVCIPCLERRPVGGPPKAARGTA